MKIQVLSDVHLEFRRYDLDFLSGLGVPGVDLLVVAGDLMNWTHQQRIEAVCARLATMARHVLYVPGNHEYYETTPQAATARAAAAATSGVVVVTAPNTVIFPGVEGGADRSVQAATLWYPEAAVVKAGVDSQDGHFVGPDGRLRQWADYRWTEDLAPWVYEQHAAAQALLDAYVGPGSIVVTHHLPHPESVHPRYRGTDNTFFLDDQAALIGRARPQLWIHGHTHEACDYVVGPTRVVANPFGYPGEKRVTAYKPLVIEV